MIQDKRIAEYVKRLRQETCPATYNPDFDKEECIRRIESYISNLEYKVNESTWAKCFDEKALFEQFEKNYKTYLGYGEDRALYFDDYVHPLIKALRQYGNVYDADNHQFYKGKDLWPMLTKEEQEEIRHEWDVDTIFKTLKDRGVF